MHDKLAKILQKKRNLSDSERDAKMDVVKHLRDMASDAMGEKMDGLKKVSVMSDSPEGLEEGLDKAKDIVSGHEMEQMKDHAENDLGDYKSALEEHADDEPNQEEGFDNEDNHYADGGQIDPQKAQEAQDSLRQAFHYDEGGEVDPDSDEDEMSEAEEPGSEEHENLEGLDIDEIKRRIEHLMELHKQMSAKKS